MGWIGRDFWLVVATVSGPVRDSCVEVGVAMGVFMGARTAREVETKCETNKHG